MGAMAKDFFVASPVLDFPLIALGLFLLVFVLITARTLSLKRASVDAAARLPFADAARSAQENGHE